MTSRLFVTTYKRVVHQPTVGVAISFGRSSLARKSSWFSRQTPKIISFSPPSSDPRDQAKCHTFARAAITRSETTARPLACRRQRCPRAPRSSRNIRSVRARPLSHRTSLYSLRQTPLGIWEDASARVARITASTPRIRLTRRRKYVAPVLLTSVANFQLRAPRRRPHEARASRVDVEEEDDEYSIRVLVREIPGHATTLRPPWVVADVSRIPYEPYAPRRQTSGGSAAHPHEVPRADPGASPLDFKPPAARVARSEAGGAKHVACF